MKVFAAGLLAAAALIVGYRLPHQSKPAVTQPAVAPLVIGSPVPNPNSMAASNGPSLAADTSTAPRRIDFVQTQAASETSGRSVSKPGGDATGAPQPATISVPAVPRVDASASLSASPTLHRISRRLEAPEIVELLRRGNEVAAKGDLVGARLLFQRAAEAGDSSAALALAGTYDPLVLERLSERGLAPDVALARFWYEKAQELGSKEAPQRLEMRTSRAN
jgi:TPR repeat protein